MLGKCRKSLTDMAVDISPQWKKNEFGTENANRFTKRVSKCIQAHPQMNV